MHFAVKKLQEQIGSYIVKMFASGTPDRTAVRTGRRSAFTSTTTLTVSLTAARKSVQWLNFPGAWRRFSAEALHELETGIGTLKNLFVTAMQALEKWR